MPLAGLPNKGLREKAFWLLDGKNFLRGVHPVSCREQLRDSCYWCSEVKYLVFVSLFTFVWWSPGNFIIHKNGQTSFLLFYGFLT